MLCQICVKNTKNRKIIRLFKKIICQNLYQFLMIFNDSKIHEYMNC